MTQKRTTSPLCRYSSHFLAAFVVVALGLSGCGNDSGPDERKTTEPIDFSGGVVVTDAWTGEWNVVLTFTDCLSGETKIVEDVVDFVCPDDTLRLAGTGLLEACSGSATDHSLDAECEYDFSDADCDVTVSMALHLDRDGDALTGSGAWSTATSASCAAPYIPGCESIAITGTRLSTNTSPCDTLHATLAHRRLLAPLLGRMRSR